MSEYFGYDHASAESDLMDAINAVGELLRILCGESGRSLANAVMNNLQKTVWTYREATERAINNSLFKVDFGYYLVYECKSLKDAKKHWMDATRAFADDKTLRPHVEFEDWLKKIQKELNIK